MPWRTDLAIECCGERGQPRINGIAQECYTFGDVRVETVKITSDEAAKKIGKPRGRYITVMTPAFASSRDVSEAEIDKIAQEIRSLLPASGTILVVGLGNGDITPDAIGPRTARQILATRHIDRKSAAQAGLGNLRPAAALAPGVFGQTGVESSEIVKALVDGIKPSAVIVIDALAARSVTRLGNTIQISDSGISPGSGVMNARKELSRESLGVPVISVGVPTVVDAATLVSDLFGSDSNDIRDGNAIQSMMITPRDIDQLVGHACHTLALAINRAMQEDLSFDVISYLMS
jgi:spore protease